MSVEVEPGAGREPGAAPAPDAGQKPGAGARPRTDEPPAPSAAWYVVLTTLLSVAQYYVERRFARGADRTPPPTPLQRARAFAHALTPLKQRATLTSLQPHRENR
ncbi:hypothetical protein [Streptomyces alboflavus]|uniref:hypothetical protein n=1 Tax=Streptomyces alboflavus TaxID=67267 RepID=UPI0004C0A3EF|nr:hypothetical protein [Streptomyces alboflavus]